MLTSPLRRLVGLLAILGLSAPVLAQTAPTWLSAAAAGTGFQALGATALDAAGNLLHGHLAASSPGTFLARFASASGTLQQLTPGFHYSATSPAAITFPKLAVTPLGDAYVLNQVATGQTAVVGSTVLLTRGQSDVLAAKYNATGTLTWVQQYGGPENEALYQARTDATGNLYAAGSFAGTAALTSTGAADAYLVKYSPQGTVEWARSGGGPDADIWLDLQLDAAGAPYVSGYFTATATYAGVALTSAGQLDAAVAAYTPQGQLRWVQQAGGPANDYAPTSASMLPPLRCLATLKARAS
jgi:hypothetical protein